MQVRPIGPEGSQKGSSTNNVGKLGDHEAKKLAGDARLGLDIPISFKSPEGAHTGTANISDEESKMVDQLGRTFIFGQKKA